MEAMSRTGIFIASLTGSVVALALVGQATDCDAFVLVLLAVVFFLGVVTIVRLVVRFPSPPEADRLWR